MKLFVDLDTLQLIEGPGFRNPVESLRFKRGDAARLDVMFLIGGSTPTTIGNPATLEIHFGAKLKGQYGADYIVHTSAWTLPAPAATSPVYSCTPSFNTTALNEALDLGGNESAEITLMGEITWREGTGAPTSTRTVQVVVENDVNRGTEGTPLSGLSPETWLDARADIKLTTGVPSAAPIYEVTIAGITRVLAFVNSVVWSDGIADSPYNSILLDESAGIWTLTDISGGSSWNSEVSATPVGVAWTLVSGTSSETPNVTESTVYPRFFHDFATSRTWIVPAANADFFELILHSSSAIADALGYTPANDSAVVKKTGAQSMSGQLELTGQTLANSTSALTAALRPFARAQSIGLRYGDGPPYMTGSGGGRTALGRYISANLTSAAAGSYTQLNYAYLMFNSGWTGGGMTFSASWIMSCTLMLRNLTAGVALRVIVGQTTSTVVTLANQNFAAAKAVAVEIYHDSGNAKVRLLSHNGSAASASSTIIDLGAVTTLFPKILRMALHNLGNGTYKLWFDAVASGNTMTKLDLNATPAISISTGPTGVGSAYCHLLTVAHVTSSGVGGGATEEIFVNNCELEYLP